MDKTGVVNSGDEDGDCGFRLFNVAPVEFPILVSVPHAGRDYPPQLQDNLRISPMELLRLEDRYADRLVTPAIDAGIPAMVVHRARAWMDLNRSEDELDPEMISGSVGQGKRSGSAKMRGGLGLVPRRLMHSGDIWKRPFLASDIEARLDSFYRPYHQAVDRALEQIHDRFGVALLVDVHSMPPLSELTGYKPKIVIGDRFGQSAASLYSEMVLQRLKQAGVAAALNHPYPGDYILRRHGNTRRNIHAIQIEVDRSLYLDSDLRDPSPGLKQTSAMLTDVLFLLSELLGRGAAPIAAE